jgi:hypothetical protein
MAEWVGCQVEGVCQVGLGWRRWFERWRLGQHDALGGVHHALARRVSGDPRAGDPASREAVAADQGKQDVLAGDLGVGEPGSLQVGPLQHEVGGG